MSRTIEVIKILYNTGFFSLWPLQLFYGMVCLLLLLRLFEKLWGNVNWREVVGQATGTKVLANPCWRMYLVHRQNENEGHFFLIRVARKVALQMKNPFIIPGVQVLETVEVNPADWLSSKKKNLGRLLEFRRPAR